MLSDEIIPDRPSIAAVSTVASPVNAPKIVTPRLLLRLGDFKDVPAIVDYYIDSQAHLAPWEPRRGIEFYTDLFWERQVGLAHQEFQQGQSLRLFLFARGGPGNALEEKIIGMISFSGISRGEAQFCYLGYSLASEMQGHGYMMEALQAAIGYVFGPLGLRRIMAHYLPRNKRSAQLLTRLGFTVEGYAREFLQINGVWEDHILTSLINCG